LLNCDETPQPLDLPQKGKRAQVAKVKGKPAREAATKNQENVTVQMTWSLSGHNYGPQIVVKRKTLDDNMLIEAPVGAAGFNDTVDVANQQTRSCLISRTDRGMQTGASFLQFLAALDAQITQLSAAEVAAGRTPILRPVVLMLDNHASRYDEEVLAAATGAARVNPRVAATASKRPAQWLNGSAARPAAPSVACARSGRVWRHARPQARLLTSLSELCVCFFRLWPLWLAIRHPARVMLTLCSLFSCKAVSEALELLCRPVGVLGGPFPPLSPGLKSYVAPVTADFLNVAH
jgi:hypothetical protein